MTLKPIINYSRLLKSERFKQEKTIRTLEEDFSSDKTRVVFSSSFRRLQQKAQVFSLETNAAVRSRLTHTLEVANTGSLIAKKVAEKLIESLLLAPEYKVPFIDITETCCLLHDIGNPPFGHFGEAAIQKWFDQNWRSIFDGVVGGIGEQQKKLLENLMNDFLYFDGNPQGIRIVSRLQDIPDDYTGNGLNLTKSQILSFVKYLGNPSEIKDSPLYKKAGYFHSEEQFVQEIRKTLNWDYRFPITFIMEAADDISYCLSDIEDGIEKGILTSEFFFKCLREELKTLRIEKLEFAGRLDSLNSRHDFFTFKIELTRYLIDYASNSFIQNQEKIKEGKLNELFEQHSKERLLLKALKNVARRRLFRSREAENKELAGYKVIFGLLECFKPLLVLSSERFSLLVEAESNINKLTGEQLDMEWRLYNKLPDKHLDAYSYMIEQLGQEQDDKVKRIFEWYYRAHLIVDYISGMTDNFALEIYRLLNGIKI